MSGFTNTFGVATDLGKGYYTTLTYHTEHGLDPAYSTLHNASKTVWVAQDGTRPPRTWSRWRECQKCSLEFPESLLIEYEGIWYCQECFDGVAEQDANREFEDVDSVEDDAD